MESMKVIEATEAKYIAEEKIERKDYTGARLFALHAQSLYPDLVGIAHMVTMLQVYVSAESRIRGFMDWYSVMGVDPYTDEGTIKKSYMKLLLMVHPDKNKCTGADGAFKLIKEAWDILSDKDKRSAYNQSIGYKQNGGASSSTSFRLFGQNIPTSASSSACTGGSSAPSPVHAGGPSNESSAKRSANIPKKQTAPPTDNTFWTECNQCNRKYEHRKIFYNSTILCHICQKPFLASETVPPVKFVKTKVFGKRTSV